MDQAPVRRIVHLLLALGLVCAAIAPVVAQEAEQSGETREMLDSIRDDLVQMRFDEALIAIESFLGRRGLSEGQRGEALVLRAQAHAAYGDFDSVAKDYADILTLRPDYAPDPSLTPAKAMTRFTKVRARMIGRIRVSVVPEDAVISIDGVPEEPDDEGLLSLLVGAHVVRAERRGHDPEEQAIDVVASQETPVGFDLVQNSRTIIVQTSPAGVAVSLDGEPVGKTETDPEGQAEAQLVIEDVPLGEHIFELTKECYRTERLSDNLTVDLLNRRPKRYKPVRMTVSQSQILLHGGPADATVWLEGKRVGPLGDEPVLACPGRRTVAVKIGNRRIWQETLVVREAIESTLDVRPRPNLVLVGVSDWPRSLESFGRSFNLIKSLDLPRDGDLARENVWESMRLPEEVDLAIAVVPSRRKGGADRWYLYSPILGRVALIDGDPPAATPPEWSAVGWGFDVVDSRTGGANRVIDVRPGSAAHRVGLRPGDRVVEIGGREVASAQQTRLTLLHARAGAPLLVRWSTPAGEARQAELLGVRGPLLVPTDSSPDAALVRAAWAVVDAIVRPEHAASAMANLGLLFSGAGQPALAADIWRRVDWGDRIGVGEGTKQYYLGRALEALGREDDAIEAYRKAAASESRAFNDEGPPVAPAALDRLADLGASRD